MALRDITDEEYLEVVKKRQVDEWIKAYTCQQGGKS